jgi:hypothetical protein
MGLKEPIQDEAFLGQVLTGLLREVDPMRIVDGLELSDDSKPTEEF